MGQCEGDCRRILIGNGYTVVERDLNPLDWIFSTDDKVHSSIEIINSRKGNQVGIGKDNYVGAHSANAWPASYEYQIHSTKFVGVLYF